MTDNGAPFYYDYINAKNSMVNPSMIRANNTGLNNFFARYLLQKAISVFSWGMPETWDKDYTLYTLYTWGYFAILNTDKFGVIPQACSLSGYNVFYRPSKVQVSNMLLGGMKELTIDKQCTLIKLMPDYGSIMDLVTFYANMLALCAENAGVNMVNTKLAYVFAATNKAAAESLKKVYDEVASGHPAVVIDKDLMNEDGSVPWEMFSQDLSANYIAGDVLSDMRKWEAEFDSKVGIPNSNTDKKERLITDEVNANNAETLTLSDMWLENLQESCRKAEKMFDIQLTVKKRESLKTAEMGGQNYGEE